MDDRLTPQVARGVLAPVRVPAGPLVGDQVGELVVRAAAKRARQHLSGRSPRPIQEHIPRHAAPAIQAQLDVPFQCGEAGQAGVGLQFVDLVALAVGAVADLVDGSLDGVPAPGAAGDNAPDQEFGVELSRGAQNRPVRGA